MLNTDIGGSSIQMILNVLRKDKGEEGKHKKLHFWYFDREKENWSINV